LDLITVSDWGTPRIMKNSGRRLSKLTTTLDSLQGWWKVVESHDIDGDGDQDLVLGNSGLNIPYKGSKAEPMKLWVNDFDENGTIEQVMTTSYDKGDYPIHMRKEMTAQLPHLKKQNLKASDYAKRTIEQIFKKEILVTSIVKTVDVSETVIAVNEGNGKFSIQPLPTRVQWSCVCGIECTDVNNDGNVDLVIGGNEYDLKPQFSRQDASYGHVLLGNGKMDFQWQNFSESGFFVRGQVKHLEMLSDKTGTKYISTAINNEEPRLFKINR
jgi:enediyne biosynthesis protein E4